MPTTSVEAERHSLSSLIAQELKVLGFPEQSFDIQASFLTHSPRDLGIILTWPLRMPRQARSSGVIQIGRQESDWKPETRALIVDARQFPPEQLRTEVREWCKSMALGVWAEVERKGGKWPADWPRLLLGG